MANLIQDLRSGWRALGARPGYTIVAVIALALGIGANTTIFSVVNAVLLKPLPYRDADRLIWIWERNPGNNIERESTSLPNFLDWQKQNRSFEQLTSWARTQATLTGTGEPEQIAGVATMANYFTTLGVTPSIGRTFTPDDNATGANKVAIVSHDFWMKRLGGDPNVTTRKIILNGNSYNIVGVMPRGFRHPEESAATPNEIWLPLTFNPAQTAGRRGDFLRVVGRLKSDVTLAGARTDMEALTARLATEYVNANAGWTVQLLTLHTRLTGDVSKILWLLLGAVGFLLLIACANVANLSLARAAAREKELAIRFALGARSGQVVRQLLTESTMLAIAGGLAGLAIAVWGLDALIAIAPRDLPRLGEVALDYRVLIFTLVVCLITGIVFGTAPAFHASRLNLNDSLKDSTRGSAEGARSRRYHRVIIIAEVAIAVVLLFGAGLTLRSFLKLQNVDPGFKPEGILSAQVLVPRSKYPEGKQISTLYDQLLTRVRSMPDVESAAVVNVLPLGGNSNFLSFNIEGRPQPRPEEVIDATVVAVAPGYFSTMAIKVLRGEEFSGKEGPDSPRVIMINEALQRRYFATEDPMGKRLSLGPGPDGQQVWMTIVGIVRDIHSQSLSEAAYPHMFLPYAQQPGRMTSFVIRTKNENDPLSLAGALKSEVRSIDPDLPLSRIAPLTRVLANSVSQPRAYMILVLLFAMVGLLLAAIGIYGVFSYSVAQRTGEFGVRLALGASGTDVLRMVLWDGAKLTAFGIGLGLAGSLALSRLMVAVLYGMSAIDFVTLFIVPAVLLAVAMLACYVPARRATRVDPLTALRYE